MKKAMPVSLALAFAACAFGQEKKAEQPPQPKRISVDLYDMTARWQVMFGLDGKLVVSGGREDVRAAAADGEVFFSFDAQPKRVGWYAFTFIQVDDLERTYQVHTVRLRVLERLKNSRPPVISPESETLNQVVSVAPEEKARVKWSYYPGGEGIPGGWRLMQTSYWNSKLPPSVPGYEKATGE